MIEGFGEVRARWYGVPGGGGSNSGGGRGSAGSLHRALRAFLFCSPRGSLADEGFDEIQKTACTGACYSTSKPERSSRGHEPKSESGLLEFVVCQSNNRDRC